jgi:hypothetical protein
MSELPAVLKPASATAMAKLANFKPASFKNLCNMT